MTPLKANQIIALVMILCIQLMILGVGTVWWRAISRQTKQTKTEKVIFVFYLAAITTSFMLIVYVVGRGWAFLIEGPLLLAGMIGRVRHYVDVGTNAPGNKAFSKDKKVRLILMVCSIMAFCVLASSFFDRYWLTYYQYSGTIVGIAHGWNKKSDQPDCAYLIASNTGQISTGQSVDLCSDALTIGTKANFTMGVGPLTGKKLVYDVSRQ